MCMYIVCLFICVQLHMCVCMCSQVYIQVNVTEYPQVVVFHPIPYSKTASLSGLELPGSLVWLAHEPQALISTSLKQELKTQVTMTDILHGFQG